MEELLSCQICFEAYDSTTHEPRVCPCGHTFCVSCINILLLASNPRSMLCPLCKFKLPRNIGQFPRNYDIIGLFSHSESECSPICLNRLDIVARYKKDIEREYEIVAGQELEVRNYETLISQTHEYLQQLSSMATNASRQLEQSRRRLAELELTVSNMELTKSNSSTVNKLGPFPSESFPPPSASERRFIDRQYSGPGHRLSLLDDIRRHRLTSTSPVPAPPPPPLRQSRTEAVHDTEIAHQDSPSVSSPDDRQSLLDDIRYIQTPTV
mmetsp:Transcript_7823/g.11654  ORF Transcript_7823/g.11654 Transcript_7823/m.11654 type:complete len:268 (-) Transcript_7823:98-901(-)